MPLLVRWSSPARNALLLEESFHEPVPSMKVADNALAYSSAFTVSGELMTTLSSLSTSQALWPHRIQCTQALPSPEAWPNAKPAGVLFFFNALQSSMKAGKSVGISLNPAFWIEEMQIGRALV